MADLVFTSGGLLVFSDSHTYDGVGGDQVTLTNQTFTVPSLTGRIFAVVMSCTPMDGFSFEVRAPDTTLWGTSVEASFQGFRVREVFDGEVHTIEPDFIPIGDSSSTTESASYYFRVHYISGVRSDYSGIIMGLDGHVGLTGTNVTAHEAGGDLSHADYDIEIDIATYPGGRVVLVGVGEGSGLEDAAPSNSLPAPNSGFTSIGQGGFTHTYLPYLYDVLTDTYYPDPDGPYTRTLDVTWYIKDLPVGSLDYTFEVDGIVWSPPPSGLGYFSQQGWATLFMQGIPDPPDKAGCCLIRDTSGQFMLFHIEPTDSSLVVDLYDESDA